MGYYAKDGSYVYEDIDDKRIITSESVNNRIVSEKELKEQAYLEKLNERNNIDYLQKKGTNYDVLHQIRTNPNAPTISDEMIKFQTKKRENQLKRDLPVKQEMKQWVIEGLPNDKTLINDTLEKGLQSREILRKYFDEVNNYLNDNFAKILNGNFDENMIKSIYGNISSQLNNYSQILIILKDKGLNFSPESLMREGLVPLDMEMLTWNLNKVQSRYGKIKMNIPSNNPKFENREGYVGPILVNLMDELNDRKISWENCMIRKPGEKSSYELFLERQRNKNLSTRNIQENNNASELLDLFDKDTTKENESSKTK